MLDQMQVQIVSLATSGAARTAVVKDAFARQFQMNADVASGVRPQVGERWMVTKSAATGGIWTFSQRIVAVRPTIVGGIPASGPMASLLSSLDDLGIIVDQSEIAIDLLGDADLDDYQQNGLWSQPDGLMATLLHHYPASGVLGFLEVREMYGVVVQRYLTIAGQEYTRSYSGVAWTSWTQSTMKGQIDGSDITSGVIPVERIPLLTPAQIPNLDASKITSGNLAFARMPLLVPLGASDLDTIIQTGTYEQFVDANATAARNYPAFGVGGRLDVQRDVNDRVWQTFTMHASSSIGPRGVREFRRAFYPGAGWSPWYTGDVFYAGNKINQDSLADGTSIVKPGSWRPLQVMRGDLPNGYRISADGTFWSRTVPDSAPYITATLTGGWSNYSDLNTSIYHRAGYAKTLVGLVSLTGLVQGGANGSTILTLPSAYRPSAKLMFLVYSSGGSARVDILPSGEVIARSAVTWLSLDSIQFPAFDAQFSVPWTNITGWLNDFASYHAIDASWPVAAYAVDIYGRVFHRGLVYRTTGVAPGVDTGMFTIPLVYGPALSLHLLGLGNGGFNSLDVIISSSLTQARWKAGSTSVAWVSLSDLRWARTIGGSDTAITLPTGGVDGWLRYSTGFPDATLRVFPDGYVMMDGLIRAGAVGAGQATHFIPPGLGADTAVGMTGLTGTLLFPINAFNALGRHDLGQHRSGSIGVNTLIPESGSNTWRSLNGINYLIGS